MKIYIAGAHSRGTTMAHYLKYINPSLEIVAYLYDNDERNPKYINGIPVIHINDNSKLDIECTVYLAMRGVNHIHVTDTLLKCGIKKIIPVDVELDLSIRNQYLKKYYNSVGREFVKIDELTDSSGCLEENVFSEKIYVAGSAFDKPLQSKYVLAFYEKTIQVGTELSEKRLDTDCFDNLYDNISNRNSQFCELTGLYWIWKNAVEDIVGLVHYRRHFILPDDWKIKMISNEVDGILPTPLYVAPSLEGNYRRRHDEKVWEKMMDILKELHPEDYQAAKYFFDKSGLYYPCNMLIVKREILNEFCGWLFPILFKVSDEIGTLEDRYQNRYPGFLSERLLTFFFEKNRTKFKIVYADKNFLA